MTRQYFIVALNLKSHCELGGCPPFTDVPGSPRNGLQFTPLGGAAGGGEPRPVAGGYGGTLILIINYSNIMVHCSNGKSLAVLTVDCKSLSRGAAGSCKGATVSEGPGEK